MTSALIQDFTERSKEVSKYFIFLKSLEQGTTKLGYQLKAKTPIQQGSQHDRDSADSEADGKDDNSSKIKIKVIDPELLKTLKASGFLLLYNLVEATMRNIIEAIFDRLKSEGISYDQIRPELKKIVLKNLKKRNPDKIFLSITAISVDIITAGFDKEDLFSGNIDGKKIRETATKYGFSHATDSARTGDGRDLLTIKEHRKNLAHGIKSFTEVGRDQATDELLEIKNKVIRYLKQILQNIEIYLENAEYLDTVVVNTP